VTPPRELAPILDDLIAWLLRLRDEPSVAAEILAPLVSDLLPRLAERLGELGSVLEGLDELSPDQAPEPPPPEGTEFVTARTRLDRPSGCQERQCIGPVVGRRGGCVGEGAVSLGWQPENEELFAPKRQSYQARCRACDALRTQPKGLRKARRQSGLRRLGRLADQCRRERATSVLVVGELRRLDIGFFEELRGGLWKLIEELDAKEPQGGLFGELR